MELKINVDETMFKDIIKKELGAFSNEELHEIIRECIIQTLKTDGTIKKLFIKPKMYSYSPEEPTQLLFEAAKSIDLSPAYKEIQEIMITELKTNYKKLLENIIMKVMINGLCDDYNFKNNLEDAVISIMNGERN